MKKTALLLFVILMQCAAMATGKPTKSSVAQGIVLDAVSGDPITGARVILSATEEVVYTDENGLFVLPVAQAESAEIRIEFVSFQSKTLVIAQTQELLHIELEELP